MANLHVSPRNTEAHRTRPSPRSISSDRGWKSGSLNPRPSRMSSYRVEDYSLDRGPLTSAYPQETNIYISRSNNRVPVLHVPLIRLNGGSTGRLHLSLSGGNRQGNYERAPPGFLVYSNRPAHSPRHKSHRQRFRPGLPTIESASESETSNSSASASSSSILLSYRELNDDGSEDLMENPTAETQPQHPTFYQKLRRSNGLEDLARLTVTGTNAHVQGNLVNAEGPNGYCGGPDAQPPIVQDEQPSSLSTPSATSSASNTCYLPTLPELEEP